MSALADSMVGNVVDHYRIDGWSNGMWFEGPDKNNPMQIQSKGHSIFNAMKNRSLALNLEDGSISSSRHVDVKIGAICQGDGGVGKLANCTTEKSKVAEHVNKCTDPQVAGQQRIDDTLILFMTSDYLDFGHSENACKSAGGTGLAKLGSREEEDVSKKLAQPMGSDSFWFWASGGDGGDCEAIKKDQTSYGYIVHECRDQLPFICEHRC